MPSELMSAQELAEYVGLPVKTIYAMNTNGSGPPRIRVGRHVRYRRAEVERWLDARTVEGGGA